MYIRTEIMKQKCNFDFFIFKRSRKLHFKLKGTIANAVLVGHTNSRHLFKVTNLFALRMYGWHTQTQMLSNAN